MVNDILEYAGRWKDFFWIVFTLSATLINLLTYFNVKRSIHQPLYNRVIEEQNRVYENILQVLFGSKNEFLINCDFQNMIRYNLISHLSKMGYLDNINLVEEIQRCYMNHLSSGEINDERLTEKLEKFDTLEINVFKNVAVTKESFQSNEKNIKIVTPGIYRLLNIRAAILKTPKFNVIFNELEQCKSNIYLPKKLKKQIVKFTDEIESAVLNKLYPIIIEEENRVINGLPGTVVKIEFSKIYNTFIESIKIDKSYRNVKREIRRLLRIDERW